MTVRVLAAVSGASWEASLVASLEGGAGGVVVVRRCVDLADLLAAAASGTARAALLSGDLRRLDRDALARLAVARVAVVGLFTPGDEVAQARLRQLGLTYVLPADESPAQIAAVVGQAVAEQSERGATSALLDYGDPADALPDLDAAEPATDEAAVDAGSGRLVAVWGPTGAPGRTTVAVNLAAELAAAGLPTLLADADVYGGVVAQVLGFLDEAPGLAAAARLANLGQLDLPALARVATIAAPRLRVLTGISRADRWTELRPAALEVVWSLARSLAAVTVVDCGFSLEQDEELSFDTAAPRRNGATLVTLAAADTVVAVGAADPVGVQRLIRGLRDLREALPGAAPRVVLNKVRRDVIGAAPEPALAAALDRYAGVREVTFVPYDLEPLDAALRQARALLDVAPSSSVRLGIAELAALLGAPSAARRRSRRLRRG
jgi:Flp pilus assembly CpaE family ATPase